MSGGHWSLLSHPLPPLPERKPTPGGHLLEPEIEVREALADATARGEIIGYSAQCCRCTFRYSRTLNGFGWNLTSWWTGYRWTPGGDIVRVDVRDEPPCPGAAPPATIQEGGREPPSRM